LIKTKNFYEKLTIPSLKDFKYSKLICFIQRLHLDNFDFVM